MQETEKWRPSRWRVSSPWRLHIRLHFRFLAPPMAFEGIVEDVTEGPAALEAPTAGKCAEKKFETIGQLAGGIAHDFNNVLGAVSGLGGKSAMTKAASTLKLRNIFAHIRQQTDRAAVLTREDCSRFARRQPSAAAARCKLNQIVENPDELSGQGDRERYRN